MSFHKKETEKNRVSGQTWIILTKASTVKDPESFLLFFFSDAVVRTNYHKYFHPKECLISNGVLNRAIGQAAAAAGNKKLNYDNDRSSGMRDKKDKQVKLRFYKRPFRYRSKPMSGGRVVKVFEFFWKLVNFWKFLNFRKIWNLWKNLSFTKNNQKSPH